MMSHPILQSAEHAVEASVAPTDWYLSKVPESTSPATMDSLKRRLRALTAAQITQQIEQAQ